MQFNRRLFLASVLSLLGLGFLTKKPTRTPSMGEEHISKHPAFAELRKRYEWNDQTHQFPHTLSNGQRNPLAGVTGFMIACR